MKSRVVLSSVYQNWETPDDLKALIWELFAIEFDPCPKDPHINGLIIQWKKRNYVNPPFAMVEAFLKKAIRERQNYDHMTVFLIPARVGTVYWQTLVEPNARMIQIIRGRITFKDAKWAAPFDSAIVVI